MRHPPHCSMWAAAALRPLKLPQLSHSHAGCIATPLKYLPNSSHFILIFPTCIFFPNYSLPPPMASISCPLFISPKLPLFPNYSPLLPSRLSFPTKSRHFSFSSIFFFFLMESWYLFCFSLTYFWGVVSGSSGFWVVLH